MALQPRETIRGAVVHLLNEQPLQCDLFALPSPADATLVCTNVRSMTGQRPVWADFADSIFYFPWGQIRFLEVPQERASGRHAPPPAAETARAAPVEEPDEEIDEDFLRRVRDA